MLVESLQTPLVPLITLLGILVLHELVVLLVDGVVRQVSKLVGLDVLGVVLFACKPRQSLMEHVDAPRVH